VIDLHLLALILMAIQGCLGGFDTLFHHELTEALAQRDTARRELGIHAVRAMIYGVLFVGLAGWAWHGALAVLLLALFAIEIVLTLWDFVTEDRTRLLPATERVTHTVLAMNGGAFVALLALTAVTWWSLPTALVWQPHGLLSGFLALCGVGVFLSGVRDAFAARSIGRRVEHEARQAHIRFAAQREHVLVTGGTGFIGQVLVRALLADGHQVTVLSRDPKRAAWLFDGRVQAVDALDAIASVHPVDVVINLAGARILGMRWSASRKQALLASRLRTTRNVIDWLAKQDHKPRMFLSASAVGYYGTQPIGDATVLTEDSPAQDIFMSELCQRWETEAARAVALGVDVATMRFGLVMGHQGALPMMLLPFLLGAGGRLGTGQQWMSWIHVRDLVRAIAHLLAKTPSPGTLRAYNFTAPESVSQIQFARTAASLLRRPAFVPTPGRPVRWLLGEQADLLLEGQRVAPTALLAEGFRFQFPDMRAALADLLGSTK
jgi:uncharacterized protein (TIGR01777 family)